MNRLFVGIWVVIGVVVGVFCIRASQETLTLLVGILVGVSILIPFCLIAVWALTRHNAQPQQGYRGDRAYPPVVVVGGQAQLPGYMPPGLSTPAPTPFYGAQRPFEVVGGEYSDRADQELMQ